MNLSLIVMELAVTPQRRNVRHKDSSDAVPSPQTLQIGDSVLVAAAALAAGCARLEPELPTPTRRSDRRRDDGTVRRGFISQVHGDRAV